MQLELSVSDLIELVPGVLVLAGVEPVPSYVARLGEVLPPHPRLFRVTITRPGIEEFTPISAK